MSPPALTGQDAWPPSRLASPTPPRMPSTPSCTGNPPTPGPDWNSCGSRNFRWPWTWLRLQGVGLSSPPTRAAVRFHSRRSAGSWSWPLIWHDWPPACPPVMNRAAARGKRTGPAIGPPPLWRRHWKKSTAPNPTRLRPRLMTVGQVALRQPSTINHQLTIHFSEWGW